MGLAKVQAIATRIAEMHKMTFQFGSEFEKNQRVDLWFERAMESVRSALATPAPAMAMAPVRKTRFETRLAALSR
jgi:hypothetical protein